MQRSIGVDLPDKFQCCIKNKMQLMFNVISAVVHIKRHCPINCVNEKLQGSVLVVFFFSNPSLIFGRGFEKKKT
jgi:hypothetical protein